MIRKEFEARAVTGAMSMICSDVREMLSDLIDVRNGEMPHMGESRLAESDMRAQTKAHLAELLFEQIGLNKRESKDMIDAFFVLIADCLVDGNDVKISGFGNFQIRTKAPRPGRNPRTGEAIPIQARRVVTFHASHKLKDQIQNNGVLS